jgi:hypothetical protein
MHQSISNINITLLSELQLAEVTTPSPLDLPQSILVDITSAETEEELCKCLCDIDATEEEMVRAIMLVIAERPKIKQVQQRRANTDNIEMRLEKINVW